MNDLTLNQISFSLESEIRKELLELSKYSTEPKHGFYIGCSVSINGILYMLTHIPYSHELTLKKAELKNIDNFNCYYDFENTIEHKTIKFNSFEDALLKIDKYLTNKNLSKTDDKGNIYLVTDGENVKIGATTYNIEKRLIELQTGNAKKLTVIGFYEVQNKLSTEKHLHNLFSEKNVLNEWFKLEKDDIDTILSEKISVVRDSKFQSFKDEDIENIKNALYSNYYEYNQIRQKKESRLKKKIEALQKKIYSINSYNCKKDTNEITK